MCRVTVAQARTYGDEIAVVTVTYSPGDTLERFLDTLQKATTLPLRVVVADNGSTDGAPEHASERAGVRLIRTGGNLGYGTAANLGVRELEDTVGWVVVANPDIEWTPGAIDTMIEAAERWGGDVGSAGPLIRQPDGTVYPSARRLPSIGRGIGHALFARMWPGNPWTRGYRQDGGEPVERTADWLSGSCLLLRREAFESVGGFDERYFMYFEDVDLGGRLTSTGWRNVYVPSAVVTHLQGYATSRESAKMLEVHHQSAYRYLCDRYPGPLWKPVLGMIRIGLAMRLRLVTRNLG